ncbi:MAG: hypothetical protein IJ060_10255 [Oscillospiraceae bacterium]|nr:hypothetical protein [Oscillospiraceae bacterium]
MKAKYLLCALMLPAFALTGCGEQVEKPTDSVADSTTTTAVTTTEAETTTGTETTTGLTETTESTTSETTVTTTSAPPPEAPDTLFTVALPADVPPAEDDGEDHADDPYPLYFNYVFSGDSVAMRLTGGNYQTISCDFSKTIDANGKVNYHLYDCNFDGDPDLLVPVSKDENKETYVMFIWNNSTKKFYETPITADNPTFSAEKKQYTTTGTLSSKQSVMVTGYQWSGSVPSIRFIVYADYKTKSLTYTDNVTGDTTTKGYDTADELTEALISYRK